MAKNESVQADYYLVKFSNGVYYVKFRDVITRDTLEEFDKIWDTRYPMIYQSWDTHWDDLSEFFKYPPEIRKAIYTTNAIESLNYQLRKVTKNRSTFPNDDAIFKILYLAIRNASEKWTMPIRDWGMAELVNYFV
jgi:transposase-like protein